MTSWTRALGAAIGALTAIWTLAGAARAQDNFDAGKSGAQLYAANCAICHKSAQGLNKSGGGLFGLESFLREHYTASRESAAAIAAYLNSVGGGPADHRPAKKKVRTDKKKEDKPSETRPDDKKKPEEKSGDKPSAPKPDKKEGGKAAHAKSAAAAPPTRG